MHYSYVQWAQKYIKCQDARPWAMDLIDSKLLLESHISMICAGFGQLGRKEVPESMGKVVVMLPVRFGGCCRPPWTLQSQVERSQKGIQRRRSDGNHLLKECSKWILMLASIIILCQECGLGGTWSSWDNNPKLGLMVWTWCECSVNGVNNDPWRSKVGTGEGLLTRYHWERLSIGCQLL
jgi:hypothetical protein